MRETSKLASYTPSPNSLPLPHLHHVGQGDGQPHVGDERRIGGTATPEHARPPLLKGIPAGRRGEGVGEGVNGVPAGQYRTREEITCREP